VREVALVESTTRAEGPAYRTLVRYALT